MENKIKYYIVKEFDNEKCIRSKRFYNLEKAILFFDNCKNKCKLYIKINNEKLINISKKINLKYNLKHYNKLSYGDIICFHTSWHDSEENGMCFDEDWHGDFIETFKYWNKYKDGIDYQKLWIHICGIGTVLIGTGNSLQNKK